MAQPVELSDKFYADPQILKAHKHSRSSVGLYVLALGVVATYHYEDYEEYCVSMFHLHDFLSEMKQPRRPINALVKAGLWEPIASHRTNVVSCWVVVQNGLWRFVPKRQSLGSTIRRAVLERDGRVCGICGGEIAPTEKLHIDHVRPVARGGTNVLSNLQPAHAVCNLSKGARV